MADRDAPFHAADTAVPPADAAAERPSGPKHWWRRLPRPARIALGVVGGPVALVLLAWAILYITKGRFLKHPFERIASAQTAREVKVAGDFQLYLDPFDIHFVAEGLTIANPAWAKGNLFEAKRIDTRIATLSLLAERQRLRWLSLDGARLDLQWDAAHRRNSWTLGDPNRPGEPLDLPLIRRARAAGTALRYRDPQMALAAELGIETVVARDTRFADAIRFSGTVRARDTGFAVSGALLTPNQTATGGQNRLALHIRGGATTADVTGTLPGATEIEGARLNVDVRGANLADLFAIAGVAVPDTRSYRITSALTKAGPEWRFTGLRGRFGESDIAGRLTIENKRPRILLTADLATRVLDIVDAGPFIGYDPHRLEARGASGAVTQVGGAPRLLPDAPLRVEALRNFDAKVDWRVRTVRAESLPVSNITLGLTLDDRLLTLSPLNFALSRGTFASDIVIDARNPRVVTDYDIRLSPTPMGTLLAGFGVAESGTSGTLKARVKMTGTGNTVRDSLATANGRIAVIIPKGTLWTRNTELAELDIGTFVQKMFEKKLKEPVEINCGLVAFTVRDGIGAADPILIDTRKNVIAGRGGFSFRNESLNLAFEADSKKFSLFSAQSPVGIDGYFARPGIDVISGELLARAGAGLGLGVALSPLAAIIAFVDFGDAKAADCGPVLAGARASAQRDTKGRPRKDVGRGTPAKSKKRA